MPEVTPDQQRKLGSALKLAHDGATDSLWLHRLVLAAGYNPVAGQGSDDLVLVNCKTLARGFGVTDRTIKDWKKNYGMPVEVENHGNRAALFDVFAVMKWYDLKEKTRLGEQIESGAVIPGGKGRWATELRRQQARKATRNNDQAEGLLVEVAQVESVCGQVGREFRRLAEAIERKHGAKVGNAIREMVDVTNEGLEKMFKKGKKK